MSPRPSHFVRCARLCFRVVPTSRISNSCPFAAAVGSACAAGFLTTTFNGIARRNLNFFEPKPDKFSALYLEEPERNTAACNAGDYLLYLGGGSINGAFGKLLQKEQGLVFSGYHPKKCLFKPTTKTCMCCFSNSAVNSEARWWLPVTFPRPVIS